MQDDGYGGTVDPQMAIRPFESSKWVVSGGVLFTRFRWALTA